MAESGGGGGAGGGGFGTGPGPERPSSMADKNGALKCTFSAPGHSTSLLQGLAALRAQGQLLDVVLTINRETFHAHKVVLAACSDYFRAMFTGGMREASQDIIELKGVSARGLRHIIDFAYSAEVTLDLDCVQDVLGAAVFLQMLPVVELCEEFLKAAMSVETCLNIGHMATTFSLASLKESVDAFTFQHFLQIAEEEDFLHLPLERLVFFLQSNRLQSCAEIDLFRAAVRWLQHDPARRPRASHVLCHIRFPLMRSSDLVDSVQTLDIMVEDVLCRQYLLEAFNYQVLPFRQHEMQSPRTVVRSDVPSLVAFGGTPYTDSDRSVSSKVYQLPEPGARHFRELTEMEVGCSHTCVAVLDNFVYVAGGQHLQYRSGEGAVDACYRYDPHRNRWLRLQAMQESRIQFQLNVLCGMVYATGGRNRAGSLASVERYCPRRNEWGYACSLKRRTWGHAGASAGGRLYISGGYGISVEDKKALHCYDPATDQWEFKAPMSEPRVLHAMVGAGGRIYALGGRMDHVDRCFDVLAVEYYVPETDQWTSVSPMRAGQSEAGCCLLDRKIYIVGGYNWRLNNVTGIVQVYNTETDEWERDLHFPESFAGIACAPVLLPRSGTRR
ncbi:kelch-like protein 26 [Mustela lutreola]|uniref:Kelch like family member 26 n=2 Tax=Neovison vison TaxID=452646 RepID=A0A8C7EU12_NEOVI|nr:kelch-like protein 26 isoform X1 [Mustela erminea]XP_059016559.1 kelch-like protein 26 [Mustela lutreola]